MTEPKQSYRLTHGLRLHGEAAFSRVFDAQMRKPVGPVVYWAVPNDVGHPRMGLSVSRRVGHAVKRNHIKRMLREAYRLTQHDWPAGYDIVLVVRRHDALTLEQYKAMFTQAMDVIHAQWVKRLKKQAGGSEKKEVK